MGSRRSAVRLAALAAACALAPGSLAAQGASVADLDVAQQLPWCTAYSVDGTGRAVGAGMPASSTQILPVVFEGGIPSVLPLLPGDEDGYAFGINDSGVVVGNSVVEVPTGAGSSIESHPVLWTRGSATDLRTLVTSGDASLLATAIDITASGTIVCGGSEPTVGALRGYVLRDGVVTDLGALNGSPTGRTYPSRINEREVVVGGSESGNGEDHAFRWERGVMTDLHSPAGIAGRTSRAFDVNRAGAVCGAADFTDDASDARTAAVWLGGQAIDLGHLGGGEAWAAGLNDLGVVVGTSLMPGGTSTAFRWKGGVVQDLNDLVDPTIGWQLSSAVDVDDDGRVVGFGIHHGVARPYVLTPDCPGGFTVYGTGCPGTGGVVPSLDGVACPAPGESFALRIDAALPGAMGGLMVGSGSGVIPVKPDCQLQVLPVVLGPLLLRTDGDGGLFLPVRLGPGTPPFTTTLQYLVADPGAAYGIASTNALRIEVF
jgi:probable HAF family extracellular repeat protein